MRYAVSHGNEIARQVGTTASMKTLLESEEAKEVIKSYDNHSRGVPLGGWPPDRVPLGYPLTLYRPYM